MKITKIAQHLENVKELDELTKRELTRAIRDAIIAEEGAINQYETIVDSTDNKKAKEVLQSIADEERVHVGELQALLDTMLLDEGELLQEGIEEVEGIKVAGKQIYQTKQEQGREKKSINPLDLMKNRKPAIPKGKTIAPKKGKGSKYNRQEWKSEIREGE